MLLRDSFVHRGVNGKHHVLAFEVLGDNLLALIKESDYQGLPLAAVRVMASCVLRALHPLHKRLSIIHTDLKPENVLLDQAQRLAPCLPASLLQTLTAQRAKAFSLYQSIRCFCRPCLLILGRKVCACL